MRTLYLECNMGVAGDMLMAALLELHPNKNRFIEKMNNLNLPGVVISSEPSSKCGITGTKIRVAVNGHEEGVHHHDHHHSNETHVHEHHHHHEHHGMNDIHKIIDKLNVPQKVKEDAESVYALIAEAESHAHGRPVDQIHFHEVGTMDAVADVIGVCLLIYDLAPEKIIASPICTGFGQVKCAHGILPVPAPATEYILRNIPCYSGQTEGELCTPTGAALLKYFVKEFTRMPVMRTEKTGYGMGNKDFETANCVRAMIGETDHKDNTVVELSCDIDDMTPEAQAFAQEILLANGALDVFMTPIHMKKSRPGILLTCICTMDKRRYMAEMIFKYTTTLGIREYVCERYILDRRIKTINTSYGDIRIKEAWGYGVNRSKIEYEDAAEIARKNDITLEDVAVEVKNNI
ncbi:MAG: nickel pincer cofactor biosynthesis protein LarC [Monoglobales bacterium]